MLLTQTVDKLDALGLFGMVLGLREQLESSQYLSLSFDERLGLLTAKPKPVIAVGWRCGSRRPSCARRRPSKVSTSGRPEVWIARSCSAWRRPVGSPPTTTC